ILYVALTRAEERLYITGNFDRTSSSMEKIYQNPNYLDMTSHLDWILAILSEDNISTEFFKGIKIKSDFDKRISLEFIENIDEIDVKYNESLVDLLNDKADSHRLSQIKESLDFTYKGKDQIGQTLKKSVTELAKDFNKESEGYQTFDVEGVRGNISFKKPGFLEEEKTYDPTEKGSLIHKVFHKLPMKVYDEKTLKLELDRLIDKKIFDKAILDLVEIDKLLNFYQKDMVK